MIFILNFPVSKPPSHLELFIQVRCIPAPTDLFLLGSNSLSFLAASLAPPWLTSLQSAGQLYWLLYPRCQRKYKVFTNSGYQRLGWRGSKEGGEWWWLVILNWIFQNGYKRGLWMFSPQGNGKCMRLGIC